jgi:hypothetical protein
VAQTRIAVRHSVSVFYRNLPLILPTSRHDDKALLKTFLSIDQPKRALEDKTVNKNVNNSPEHG